MPVEGMQFKSREDAQNFLNMYSYVDGFSIVVVSIYRTTSKKRNNEITRAKKDMIAFKFIKLTLMKNSRQKTLEKITDSQQDFAKSS
jgi:hypothetical protein